MNSRKSIVPVTSALILVSFLSSCSVVTGIFKGGMYFGIVLVIIVIAIIIWLISRIGRR